MAATTYFMLCSTGNVITAISLADDFDSALVGGIVRSASFSSSEGDSPDVLREKPVTGDLFVEDPLAYTPQNIGSIKPCVKLEWSGHGAADPDDSVYEMEANGVNQCTLTVRKWSMGDDVAIQEAGDKFGVCVIGHTNCPDSRFSLDANGEHTILFTPQDGDLGEIEVVIVPISSDCGKVGIRLRLV